MTIPPTPTVAAATAPGIKTPIHQRTLWGDAARRFAQNRLAMIGLVILLLFVFIAITVNVIAPYGLNEADFRVPTNSLPFQHPTHPLGTDGVGRDYLTRLLYGARSSLLVGLSVALISFVIGVPIGAVAGYRGGRADFIALRLVEIMTAVPPLLFALFLLSVVGSGMMNVIFVLSVTTWIEPLRITRGQFLALREREFTLSARSVGATDWQIIRSHILPNALTPLIVSFTFAVPMAIFAEAALSFLGLGITEPTASWGQMVGKGGGTGLQIHYHLALFPTVLVGLTMLSFSFVGDGLQEALNPRRSR
jgi:ABC-type dipeptide/oligopeptide/nickel transport system permease subunit